LSKYKINEGGKYNQRFIYSAQNGHEAGEGMTKHSRYGGVPDVTSSRTTASFGKRGGPKDSLLLEEAQHISTL
jgi:hypothetical protein